jgi:hypothetical protein
MDSSARTGKSNRVLPAYQEVCLKAKRHAVLADSSFTKRVLTAQQARQLGLPGGHGQGPRNQFPSAWCNPSDAALVRHIGALPGKDR